MDNLTSVLEHEIGQQKDTTHYHTKFVLAPIISYEPTTSLAFGVGAKVLFKFPKSFEETRTSNIPLSTRYTLKKQFIFRSDFTVFTNQEKWMIKGEVSALKYPFLYYGIGTNSSSQDEIDLTYNQFLFEPLILKKIKGYLFVGGGLRFNNIYNVSEIEDLHPLENWQDSIGVKSLGFQLAISYDSRNNVLNASEGYLLEYTLGTYDKSFGSTHDFSLSMLNFRYYFEPWKNNADVLAMEFFSRFSWGDVPVAEYSIIGGQRILRGLPEARYRDRHAMYVQLEYRWQTFDRIGFVYFTGFGDVFHRVGDITTGTFKYNVGTGLRLKLVKAENLNVRFDYGLSFGNEFDHNIYLGIAEAF